MSETEAAVQIKEAPGETAPWKRIYDVAKEEGTVSNHKFISVNQDALLIAIDQKFSDSTTQSVTPSTLLGTYFCVWDSHTGMESMDEFDHEISWIDLTLNKSTNAEASSKDSKNEASFADINGEFRWWRKIGSLKETTGPRTTSGSLTM